MDRKRMQKFRDLLLEKRGELAGDVVSLRNSGRELGHDGTQDSCDDAANDTARLVSMSLSETERGVLREIDAALERIDEGSYGVCGDCGETIATQRLEALPYATLCVDCKEERERE